MRNDSAFPLSPRARRAAGAVLMLLLSALPGVSRAEEDLFTIQQVNGRLALVPRAVATTQPAQSGEADAQTTTRRGLRCWRREEDRLEFEDYNPRGYFDGSIYVRARGAAGAAGPAGAAGETLQLGGRRQNFHDWEVIDFSLTQGAHEVSASYTVRTPINLPDVTFRLSEPSLTLLLIRHPEVRPMLDAVLLAAGDETGYGFDPAVLAQVHPCRWDEPEGLAEAVAALLPKLDSADWRERGRAEKDLAALGRDGALYLLLRLDRHALSAQQNLGIDHVVSRYPVLCAADVRLCRQEPSRIGASRDTAIGRTE